MKMSYVVDRETRTVIVLYVREVIVVATQGCQISIVNSRVLGEATLQLVGYFKWLFVAVKTTLITPMSDSDVVFITNLFVDVFQVSQAGLVMTAPPEDLQTTVQDDALHSAFVLYYYVVSAGEPTVQKTFAKGNIVNAAPS